MPTILIVEDHETNRDMLLRRLQKRGFDVRVAINGLEAVTAARDLPDLILMDLSLPELDGIEATCRIKGDPATAGVPIIALTAHAMVTDRERALAAGCDDFDTKPVDFPRLLEKIGTQLRTRSTDTAPVRESGVTPAQPLPSPTAEGAGEGTLLLVDDDATNRDMLSRRLEKRGYTVHCVSCGRDALASVAKRDYDAVLLDVMMPEMSGLETLAHLRAAHSPADLPIVMITARDRSEDVVEALELGANDYITKPVDFGIAAARIRTHVQARRLQRSVRMREQRYALAARASSDAVWDWDIGQGSVYFSEQWARLTGEGDAPLVAGLDDWLALIHPADRECVRTALDDHLRGRMPHWESEHRVHHADGSYRWVLARGVTVLDDSGRPIRMAGSIADVTDARGSDPLTGLPNRLLFLDRLERVLQAPAPRRCAVLFLDLDRFKEINDSLGHLAGDELLQVVARRIETGLRRGDMVGHLSERATLSRFGGDEFAVLLDEVGDERTALAVADRVSQALRQPLLVDGRELSVSASIGIVVSGRHTTALDLLRDADLAMYRAKARGRGRVELFDDSMRQELQYRLALEADLQQALARGEFELLYQPIVDLQGGNLHGFEALLRWRHPARGLLAPDSFLPIVEESGHIVELGRWILRESCRQLRAWEPHHPAGRTLSMSVNVSAQQFSVPDLVDDVAAVLAEFELEPQRLKLEIVETMLLEGSEAVLSTLQRLRALGVRLVLDDFGTGYSSLGYLQAFPLSTLKIDRSFITRMTGPSSEPLEIVRTIVALAHTLGLDVTAEGIETSQQLTSLRQLACGYGQGYFFDRPLSPSDVEKLLARGRSDGGSPCIALGPAVEVPPQSPALVHLV